MTSPLPPLKPRWLPFRVLPDTKGIYEVLHDTGEIAQEYFNGRNWPELRGKWSAQKWRTKK